MGLAGQRDGLACRSCQSPSGADGMRRVNAGAMGGPRRLGRSGAGPVIVGLHTHTLGCCVPPMLGAIGLRGPDRKTWKLAV
ncbi:hypothetical protein PSAC2689_120047 [Paraburkholderia sacchari]